MSLETFKAALPEFAKDIRLNLSQLFSQTEGSVLTEQQFNGVALAVVYSLKNDQLIRFVKSSIGDKIDPNLENAAKTAATLMAMNNVYYRFIHLVEDKSFSSMPAQLRMNGLQTHGLDKQDFELLALAVSAINGCGLCMDSHVKALIREGMDKRAIHTTIRLTAVLNGASQALASAS